MLNCVNQNGWPFFFMELIYINLKFRPKDFQSELTALTVLIISVIKTRFHSPTAGFQQTVSHLQGCHAKICYPDVILLIQQQVLRLQVPVTVREQMKKKTRCENCSLSSHSNTAYYSIFGLVSARLVVSLNLWDAFQFSLFLLFLSFSTTSLQEPVWAFHERCVSVWC